ncbi:blood vessel epicardial substance-A-like [Planococcus citri]|uniref:blood vessel epicardial substance-A-like n=1 Tax=Planococcus citri TaxID=170843 RepID=UPI0031F857ED
MEKNRKIPSLNKSEETSTVRIVSTPKSVVLRTMENSSSNDVLRNYTTSSWMPDDYLSYTSSHFNSFDNITSRLYLSNSTTNGAEKITCQWETAQHNLFQFSNMCFLSAFAIPRNYKSSILLFRIILTVSFVISAIWAGVHFCALDWFIWSSGLALTNSVHAVVLTFKFLPPALSLELTELYIRMFKPLKVSKKHFKELTKEACLLRLAPGETYAIEEVSPADERLSILLKGRLKVSCNGTFLHNISSYQFIDSPEWQANVTATGTRFQVTISAEEDSLIITWPRIQLDRILRHRPLLGFIFSNLIGKDITHKMYSLNEQIGQMCTTEALSRAAKEDHWRRSMNRSVSVDAVDTGTRGQVRSTAWKQAERYRKSSTHSENASPLLGPQQCWLPLVASQFPAECPFITQDDSITSQDDEKEPMLPKNSSRHEPTQIVQFPQSIPQPIQILSQFPKLDPNMPPVSLINVATSSSFLGNQSVALIPVIVPVLATTVNTSVTNSVSTAPTTSTSRAASLKRQRGVKFDETQL